MVNGDKLRGVLAEKRLSYGELALKLGIHRDTLSKRIRMDTLTVRDVDRICELLDILSWSALLTSFIWMTPVLFFLPKDSPIW